MNLKPCPFCGSEPQLEHHEPHSHGFQAADYKMPDHPGSWTILCTGCSCGMINETREAVIAEWNRRASPEPLTDEQIMAIGRELGKQCKLGGNPNIDFDYARAIEKAHGIGAGE